MKDVQQVNSKKPHHCAKCDETFSQSSCLNTDERLFSVYSIHSVIIDISSSHPSRYDEQTKLQKDHDTVLQNIKDKLAECQQWQAQHEVLFSGVH